MRWDLKLLPYLKEGVRFCIVELVFGFSLAKGEKKREGIFNVSLKLLRCLTLTFVSVYSSLDMLDMKRITRGVI